MSGLTPTGWWRLKDDGEKYTRKFISYAKLIHTVRTCDVIVLGIDTEWMTPFSCEHRRICEPKDKPMIIDTTASQILNLLWKSVTEHVELYEVQLFSDLQSRIIHASSYEVRRVRFKPFQISKTRIYFSLFTIKKKKLLCLTTTQQQTTTPTLILQ